MFETSLDAWYTWLGVALVSLAVFGLVVALPSSAPPDAAAAADTIDSVASSPHEPRETVDITATEIQLSPHQISLRSDGGTDHAALAYGPITPVRLESLETVLGGTSPSTVFESESAFADAVDESTDRGEWRPAPDRLAVTRVSWGETSATLVG